MHIVGSRPPLPILREARCQPSRDRYVLQAFDATVHRLFRRGLSSWSHLEWLSSFESLMHAGAGHCGYYNSIFASTPMLESQLPLRSLISLQTTAVCFTMNRSERSTGTQSQAHKTSPSFSHATSSYQHVGQVTVSGRTAYLYEFKITTTRIYVTKIQAIQGYRAPFQFFMRYLAKNSWEPASRTHPTPRRTRLSEFGPPPPRAHSCP